MGDFDMNQFTNMVDMSGFEDGDDVEEDMRVVCEGK